MIGPNCIWMLVPQSLCPEPVSFSLLLGSTHQLWFGQEQLRIGPGCFGSLIMATRSVKIAPISFLLLGICIFSLYLCHSCWFLNLINFFKESDFCFIDFLFLMSMISAFIFVIYLLLFALVLFCSFLVF